MANDPARPPIGLDEVKNIARLANLDLGAEELDRMTRELASILGYVRQLQELDVTDVEATMGGLRGAPLPLRPDDPHQSLPRELALREAPRTADGGFAVPAFVDEG